MDEDKMIIDAVDINGVEVVDESQIPMIIGTQFDVITNLDAKAKAAREKAKNAQALANNKKSAGFGKKKAAIESLQDVTIQITDAQETMVDAQELSFQYQEKLGEVTKKLFSLGMNNIVNNRTVVRELELRLRNSSEEEISELARQEMMDVISQLKAQEDVIKKQLDLAQKVKQHDQKLKEHESVDAKQYAILTVQAERDLEHDKLLKENEIKDDEQDKELKKQAQKDEEHDRLFKANEEKNAAYDLELKERAKKDAQHDKIFADVISDNNKREKLFIEYEEKQNEVVNDLIRRNEELREELMKEKMEIESLHKLINDADNNIYIFRKYFYISIGIASIAIVMSILQFII